MKKMVFFWLVTLFSCVENVEKPKDLIAEDKMVQILTDIYIHQQSTYMNALGGKPLDYAKVNAHLVNTHGVSVEDFEKSYEYYLLNPDLYESILIEIREELESQLPQEERMKREQTRKNEQSSERK